jgi:hypothetical protein
MKSLVAICSLLLLSLGAARADDTASTSRVLFGVNGHPMNDGAYGGSLDQQIAEIASLGLRTYRVNVNPTFPVDFDRLTQLTDIAQRHGILIQLVVVIPASKYASETAAYADAKTMVSDLASKIGNRVVFWELGNEYDLYCLIPGASGTAPGDFDTDKYDVVRGLVKGMLDGLHQGSPSASSIVETSENGRNPDSGFLQRLIGDDVRFDITGYHYYSKDGRIPIGAEGRDALQVLHDEFHKPIWITEFDEQAHGDTGPSADPETQGRALSAAMTEISMEAARYDVAAAEIYELLDEPQLLTHPGVKPAQAQFGISDSGGGLTAASKAVKQFLDSYYPATH